ncbi:potassium/proton antiporter [Alicyclobacillus fastidiosus]|uniref:Potassium/proton antiporter n=1 Tax=Alicyclobacillus fastidiosus TaxID=392011 RepID=A0ABV5AHB7_9BACL|nr:potassium/proton antiporter [Alicyclobacillus fastidiosus]WEH09235.1 potassium/proton antiporter [Alicyclobacillus fastidiosus]
MNTITLVVAVVLLCGVLLVRVNKQLGFPALISFVGIGAVYAAIYPAVFETITPTTAKDLSYLALAFILFEGGLHTSLRRVKRAFAPSISLATVGVVVSAAIMTALAYKLLHVSFIAAALLGVAASSTDAASVFSVLGGTALRRRLVDVMELESGTNDPMAFFLTTILIEWQRLTSHSITQALWYTLVLFLLQMGVGFFIGLLTGIFGSFINRSIDLDTGGMYPAFTLGLALLSFALAQSLYGSGFLAVYVTSVVLSNRRLEHRYSILRFHEGLAWTMHILMFVVLGLFLVPRDVAYLAGPGVLLAVGALFLARPAAVWVSTLWMGFTAKERAFMAWAGLRGAAPIVLILSAVEAQVTGYIVLIEVVFFVVIASTLVQGLTVNWVAEKLDLLEPTPSENILDLISITRENAVILPVEIGQTSRLVDKRMVEVKFPENTLCYGIVRGDQVVVPRGATKLRPGDHLLILSDLRHIASLKHLFQGEQVGPPAMLP